MLAGPLSNFVLAYLALLICSGVFHFAPDHVIFAYIILFFCYLAVLSVGLGLFNLIPIPPLDGSKLLFFVLLLQVLNHVMELIFSHFLLILRRNFIL